MNWSQLKTKQIDAEISEQVGRVHGYFDWRAQQWLGLQLPNLPEKRYEYTPLALSLRAIFDHVTGAALSPETIRDSCQLVCEALFVAPGNAGVEYEIPAEFWDTLTGQAIQAALGDPRPDWPDDKILESAEACEIAGVTRETLRLWRESGRLEPIDQGGATGGYRYLAGEVRKAKNRD